MAVRISNIDQLAKALEPTLMGMVNQMAERVYETLNFFLNDYYEGWTPLSYRRTQAFLRFAVKADAKMVGNKCVASVYIDYESMDEYLNATGYQVAEWANIGTHGGLSVSHKPRVWDDTIDKTVNNDSLLDMAVKYLRSHGFNVRK